MKGDLRFQATMFLLTPEAIETASSSGTALHDLLEAFGRKTFEAGAEKMRAAIIEGLEPEGIEWAYDLVKAAKVAP